MLSQQYEPYYSANESNNSQSSEILVQFARCPYDLKGAIFKRSQWKVSNEALEHNQITDKLDQCQRRQSQPLVGHTSSNNLLSQQNQSSLSEPKAILTGPFGQAHIVQVRKEQIFVVTTNPHSDEEQSVYKHTSIRSNLPRSRQSKLKNNHHKLIQHKSSRLKESNTPFKIFNQVSRAWIVRVGKKKGPNINNPIDRQVNETITDKNTPKIGETVQAESLIIETDPKELDDVSNQSSSQSYLFSSAHSIPQQSQLLQIPKVKAPTLSQKGLLKRKLKQISKMTRHSWRPEDNFNESRNK